MVSLMATPTDSSPITTAMGSTMDISFPVYLMVMVTEVLVATEVLEVTEGMEGALEAMEGDFQPTKT